MNRKPKEAHPRIQTPYLKPEAAAAYLHMHPMTLAKLRRDGTGPKFAWLGSKVGYRPEWLETWAEKRQPTHKPRGRKPRVAEIEAAESRRAAVAS